MYIMRPFLAASSSLSTTSLCALIPRRLLRFSLPLQPQLRQYTSKKLSKHKQTHPTRLPSSKGINMSQSIYIDETPDDVKNAKGLHLVTQSTPNGQKVQILLEELKDKYDLKFTTTVIDISTNEQKKEWFLRLNPNGRIPVLIDNNQSPPFPVFETSAILLYLVRNYDPDYHFRFKDELQLSQANQWLIFWHGSGAPYQGNTNFFRRQAEQIPFAINRFRNETLRVYEVLEIQLSGRYTGVERDYLAGNGKGRYSVAELGTWPWVKGWKNTGFTEEELAKFPHLLRWIDRVAAREAVQRGIGEAYQKK